MGLIVFEILFVLIFIVLSLSFIIRKDRHGFALSFISITGTLVTGLLSILYVLLYFDISGIHTMIITKVIYVGVAAVTGMLLYLALKAPYFDKKKLPTIIAIAVGIIDASLVSYIRELGWDALSGFYFDSAPRAFGLPFSGIYAFSVLNYLVMPLTCALILIIRTHFIKSNIYKQQLRLTALAFVIFSAIEVAVAWAAGYLFSWLIAFLPVGYLLLAVLLSYIFSMSVVLDKRELGQGILRFLFFTLLFAVIGGFLTGYFLTYIRSFRLQIIAIASSIGLVLLAREIVITAFASVFRSSTDYEKDLEKVLQMLDYTTGRENVIYTVVDALKKYVGCSTVDILVADEKFNLNIEYSTQGVHGLIETDKPAINYLIERNVNVLLHTEVVTSYEYTPYKADLNELFWKTKSDIAVLVRDGQKLIAVFMLGHRLKKAEYGYYDVAVFKKFYSYFFLVSYYLRNIAKQDIMITVDRELEMSGQIIGAIQASVNKIEDKVISVDSASYSAHKLGGDFIDFIKLTGEKYFFLIGDVSGKGLSASMSMVILKSILRTYLENSKDFKELVVKLNIFIKENLPRGTFFAGLFGILDLKTQTIFYLNCGIPLMSMYIKSYNNAIEIQGEGRVLGFVKKIEPFLKIRKITMHPGDIIVFTTDGLLDSENLRGDRFGKDRVASIVSRNHAMTSKELTEEIYTKVTDFVARELQDDVTVLVFKHNG